VLVRSKSETKAEKRLNEVLGIFSPEIEIDQVKTKIQVLRGNISLERLGFSESLYQRLSSEVTHIIHSTALVRFNFLLKYALTEAFCNRHRQLNSEKRSFLQAKCLYLSKFLLTLGGFVL
jgi:hypothetical protein